MAFLSEGSFSRWLTLVARDQAAELNQRSKWEKRSRFEVFVLALNIKMIPTRIQHGIFAVQ
jgi:hypothetical protein